MKRKYGDLENTMQINREMKITMEEIKKENSTLMEKCNKYEATLEGLRTKVDTKVETVKGGAICEGKLEEMRKAWKKEQEEEKVNFAEVVKQQIQEKTKNAVIKVD